MLARFRARYASMELVVANGEEYRSTDEFDRIFANQAAQYWKPDQLARFLDNARDMLAPGGRLWLPASQYSRHCPEAATRLTTPRFYEAAGKRGRRLRQEDGNPASPNLGVPPLRRVGSLLISVPLAQSHRRLQALVYSAVTCRDVLKRRGEWMHPGDRLSSSRSCRAFRLAGEHLRRSMWGGRR